MSAFIVESETLDKIITAIVHDRDGDFWRRKLLGKFGFDISPDKAVIFVFAVRLGLLLQCLQ